MHGKFRSHTSKNNTIRVAGEMLISSHPQVHPKTQRLCVAEDEGSEADEVDEGEKGGDGGDGAVTAKPVTILQSIIKQSDPPIVLRKTLPSQQWVLKTERNGQITAQRSEREEWSLDDAAYHIRRATKPRVHQGLVTFGPHLTWPLRALERANGTKVVHHQLYSAPDADSQEGSTVIRCDATVCGNSLIDSISNCILADFF
jgi:hypothetical protein